MGDTRICVGVITGAQGVRGAVRIKSFTATPGDVASYGPVADEAGKRTLSLRLVGRAKGVVIARIVGVEDRDAAEAMKGTRLYVERSALPAAGDEEYYHADLIGLAVVLQDGTALGRVRAVHEYGAGDSIEVAREAGGSVLVPFTRAAVPVVDLAGGRLVVDPPDGLFDNRPVEADMEADAQRDRAEADGESERGSGWAVTAWLATVLTIFPEMFPGPLGASLAGKALREGIWRLETVDIRDFARDKHRSVDDAPFGGGPGMVMRPDVVDAALAGAGGCGPLVYLSPRGRLLDQERVRELAGGPGVRVLCGRFEGVDERVIEARGIEEISLGDFVLSGGEPAAIALLDACVRVLPGVVGAAESLAEESFERGLLEYPHFTRPQDWQGRAVPEILLSGHHERIRAWRLARAEETTRQRRPDLWARYVKAKGPAA